MPLPGTSESRAVWAREGRLRVGPRVRLQYRGGDGVGVGCVGSWQNFAASGRVGELKSWKPGMLPQGWALQEFSFSELQVFTLLPHRGAGVPEPLAPNIACLDYSVAKPGGKLVAYRWSGC